jgi:hypothetical protein
MPWCAWGDDRHPRPRGRGRRGARTPGRRSSRTSSPRRSKAAGRDARAGAAGVLGEEDRGECRTSSSAARRGVELARRAWSWYELELTRLDLPHVAFLRALLERHLRAGSRAGLGREPGRRGAPGRSSAAPRVGPFDVRDAVPPDALDDGALVGRRRHRAARTRSRTCRALVGDEAEAARLAQGRPVEGVDAGLPEGLVAVRTTARCSPWAVGGGTCSALARSSAVSGSVELVPCAPGPPLGPGHGRHRGTFDGVHRGTGRCSRRSASAPRHRTPERLLTFDPHPLRIVRPGARAAPAHHAAGEEGDPGRERGRVRGVPLVHQGALALPRGASWRRCWWAARRRGARDRLRPRLRPRIARATWTRCVAIGAELGFAVDVVAPVRSDGSADLVLAHPQRARRRGHAGGARSVWEGHTRSAGWSCGRGEGRGLGFPTANLRRGQRRQADPARRASTRCGG